jgi:hypothetical protein
MLRRASAFVVALFLLVLGLGLATYERVEPWVDPSAYVPPPAGPSWAPAPVQRGGLTTLAESQGKRIALHTVSGDVTFWTGVNLGSTTPGYSPGELEISREDYRRWFDQMGRMGVRVLRIYTIHKPHMYEELLSYNEAHPDAPLYLMQGVYIPDESYVHTRDLYAKPATDAFTVELKAASDAVHGDLTRAPVLGRSSGTWTADVSRWVAAWIIGVEWDPAATFESDALNAAAPEHRGTYFSSVADATPTTPTERWVAARMDELATAEVARGFSAPIALVNWPTADPLVHPHEPLASEDMVGVDANHVRPTAAWPGGTFASFHAYPYYPDFLRHEPGYQTKLVGGEPDAYAAYLADLDRHFADMPLMITEVGVPSSLGSAHYGTRGRDQGDHSEQDALATDADLVRLISDLDLAGALIFAWSDEWFKFTWNTLPRHGVVDSERRSLWHDPLTNEQWFGLNAEDPVPVGRRVVYEARTGVREVAVDHDASYLHVDVSLAKKPKERLRLGFDLLPGGLPLPGGGGGSASDVSVVVDPGRRTATARIRGDLDPILLDGLPPDAVPKPGPDGWSFQQMTTNRPFTLRDGRELDAEFLPIGDLKEGVWDRRSTQQDSRATWQLNGTTLRLRIPWSMLALGDPTSHTAVQPVDGQPVAVQVPEIKVLVNAGKAGTVSGVVGWDGWNIASHRERLKPGIQPLVDAWSQLSRPVAPPA